MRFSYRYTDSYISASNIPNRVGFFCILIGRIFYDACTSYGSDSDKGVIFFGDRLRFFISLEGCLFVKSGCSSRLLSFVVFWLVDW